MASEKRSVEEMEAELRAVGENIRSLERELELMEQRERAQQLPRREAAAEKLREATPHCRPSTDEAAVSKAGGRACVAPFAAAARLQEPLPDAGPEGLAYSDHAKTAENKREGVALHPREAVIAVNELKGQTSNLVAEAAGRSGCNHRSQSDAVGGQGASAALSPRGVVDDTECRGEPAVAAPREKKSDRVEQYVLVWPTCPPGIVLQRADERRVQGSAGRGHKPLEIEHRVAPVWSPERAGEHRWSWSEGGTDILLVGKCPFAGKGLPGHVSHCEARVSFMHRRGEFSPARTEYPATVRRSFWVAWGYFGQVWLFGGQVKLEVELRRVAALGEDGRVPISLRCS